MTGPRHPIAYTLDDPCMVDGRCPDCGVVPCAGFEDHLEHGCVVLVVWFEHEPGCAVLRDDWEPAA